MTEPYKKVGIFGGTFDPIHMGHLFLAEAARDKFCLDRVLFMPDPAPYHRANAALSSLSDRVNMTTLAIKDNPGFEYSDFEISLPGETYTARTLAAFHEKYPDTKIFFILGGDSLFSIEFWKEPEKIFSLAAILSGKREDQALGASGTLHPDRTQLSGSQPASGENINGGLDEKIRELQRRFGAEIYNLYVPNIEISSSDIKNRIRDGRSIKYCTPDRVVDYIYEKGLYRDGNVIH